MNQTIQYYNDTAADFVAGTVESNMSEQYKMFEKYLSSDARVLDLGCGSGRDIKYFMSKGYDVSAIDGSEALCKIASEFTGIDVAHMMFQDIAYENEFDGIWACASLLHVPKNELVDVLGKLKTALKSNGVLYVSFKYGIFEGERNGRFFTDLTEETLTDMVKEIYGFKVHETYISEDVRPGRSDEKWLNAILVKA